MDDERAVRDYYSKRRPVTMDGREAAKIIRDYLAAEQAYTVSKIIAGWDGTDWQGLARMLNARMDLQLLAARLEAGQIGPAPETPSAGRTT